MAIDSIGAPAPATAPRASANIGIQDFIRILTTQLNNQDPLKPMDNQEFVAQLAQFTSLQETQALNDKVASLLTIQSATQSIGLIGRTVDLNTPSGPQSGQVTSLDFSNGQPQLTVTLNIGTVLRDVSLSSVVGIH